MPRKVFKQFATAVSWLAAWSALNTRGVFEVEPRHESVPPGQAKSPAQHGHCGSEPDELKIADGSTKDQNIMFSNRRFTPDPAKICV